MNPNALQTKAQQRGWNVVTERDAHGPILTLVRDDWELWVAFSGKVPESATLRKPGRPEPGRLVLREIGMWVRRDRTQMSRFAIGDRVTVAGRIGTVTDILLDKSRISGKSGRVRLQVAYDGGGVSIPYSEQVHRPHAQAGQR
ncbi:hypothetical protein [Nonomuraea longicatena]|uniref:Uncharacterized protein n=1 Tax=Nonomuraea longicatena TaxID=83682 RepID=A0ABN1PLB2_9ACTN